MENILEVKNLCKTYNGFNLENVSFTLPRGYIMGLIGPNGAGKSTTIKLIMNLVNRDSGSVKLFGLDNIKSQKEIKQKIGFVYDENCFYENLTTAQMKNIIKMFYDNWDDKLFNKYMNEFSIPQNKSIKKLSKGTKMKYSLAIALSHNADFIIMDEPTSGLDPVFRSEMLDILYSVIQDENKGILFSTHITSDLEKTADYITFLNSGHIVFSETKDAVLEDYTIIKGDRNLLTPDIESYFIGIEKNDFGFEGLTNKASKIAKLSQNKVLIEKASLDDIMIYTVNRHRNLS